MGGGGRGGGGGYGGGYGGGFGRQAQFGGGYGRGGKFLQHFHCFLVQIWQIFFSFKNIFSTSFCLKA